MPASKQRLATLAAISASALAATGIANAATKTDTSTTKSSAAATETAGPPRANNETVLTGAALKSASDAAIAANPGATVTRASTEDPADAGGAAYEIKITTADGTRAEVVEDASFKVLSTKADTGRGGRGGHHDGGGGNPNEKALTGTDLEKATAAAKAAVRGGTIDRASTEDPAEGTKSAYEVHVEKADGSHVTVLLGSSFDLAKTVTDQGRGHRG